MTSAHMRRSVLPALLILLLLPPAAAADPDRFNRAMLGFNHWFLRDVMEPVARGYNVVVPKWGQRRVVAFMGNLEEPRDVVNSLLQAKFKRAGIHGARLVVNTSVGVVGLFDVAGQHLEWKANPETLDESFGVWGLPPGSYVILPVIGEFCVRSFVGWIGDGALNPLSWVPVPPATVTAGAYVLRSVNLLAQGMPSPCAPEGEWEAYKQSRFEFAPYEQGRELFFEDEADRVRD